MGLIERVYKTEREEEVYRISPFWYFDPSAKVLGNKSIREAIESGNSDYFVNLIRNDFHPGEGNRETDEYIRNAINRGVVAINELSQEYLGEDSKYFALSEVFQPFDSLTLFTEARMKYIDSRNGRHAQDKDHEMFFDAYNFVRSWGVGKTVMTIDTSPEVLNSLRYGERIREWLDNNLRFRRPKDSDVEGLSTVWKTDVEEVYVYGTGSNPFRSRTKITDESGNLRYSSIMMKMFNERRFTDSIRDNYGVEFVVENDGARNKLVNYFQHFVKGGGHLESFKSSGEKGKNKRSASSSAEFDVVKFILRPPIEVPKILPYHEKVFERTPVEVQILTLEGHRSRMENPEQTHEAYKKRQFEKVFPIWFPREVYEPLLKDVK